MTHDESTPGVLLRDADASDQAAIRALLRADDLPVSDLDTSHVRFVVACQGRRVVGVAGLEAHGDVALLRSLAVEARMRSAGLGARLVGAIETHARASGIGTVVLLTTTAKEFFAARGYTVIHRHEAPVAVQTSAEFRALCPASAVCMLRRLPPAP